jgi:hypothetical protein
MIANLTGRVTSMIRLTFGVIPWMTPKRVMDLSHDVGRVILDHLGRLHDVRTLRDEDGNLRFPPEAADISQARPPRRKAGRWVELGYDEEIDILLPDDRRVSVLLSYLEPGKQFPEVDIKLDADLTLNCFGRNLRPASAAALEPHILEGCQIIIPLSAPADPRTGGTADEDPGGIHYRQC